MARARAAVILAAGQGTRMKSATPKVLHAVGGRTMLDWSIALARDLGCSPIIVVGGVHNPQVAAHAERALGPGSVAIQDPPLGTAHAVSASIEGWRDAEGDLVVLYADTPLIEAATVERLFEQLAAGAGVTVLGFEPPEPGAYGRLILGPDGGLERIVEAKDATPEERAVRLCNSGVLAADAGLLRDLLAKVGNDNSKGEYYLTDVVGLARAAGRRCAVTVCDPAEVAGVNSRGELAEAEAAFQARRRAALMADGVTMVAPETVFLSHDTVLEADVHLEPNVVFGPGVIARSGARLRAFSHFEGCEIGPGAIVGPFARLRPGTVLGRDVHIGNFVEAKNAKIGDGAKANHLTYLGDADVGAKANIGAGTITCNYDGFRKSKTVIGEGAFIGSDTMLVAPVTVGAGAYTGSGSVITKDVPADALAVERGELRVRAGWAAAFRANNAK
jgi:bifunctional UDP-N-acetylglucosamine pyrophosphorylase / glucosamine-1-phosphate N-acetyltransferase